MNQDILTLIQKSADKRILAIITAYIPYKNKWTDNFRRRI